MKTLNGWKSCSTDKEIFTVWNIQLIKILILSDLLRFSDSREFHAYVGYALAEYSGYLDGPQAGCVQDCNLL